MNKIVLGVTQVSDFECPRRAILALLLTRAGLTQDITPSKAMLQGNILHNITQDLFRYYFDYVQYFVFRKNDSLNDALERSLDFLMDGWRELLVSQSHDGLNRNSRLLAIQGAEDQLHNLANIARHAVFQKEESLDSYVVSNEYRVVSNIDDIVILRGRIDLLLYQDNKLKVIEIKTGSERSSDYIQVQLYGDMLSEVYHDQDITMELWYPKSNRISPVTHSGGKTLEILKNRLKLGSSITSIDNLPSRRVENRYICNWCNQCNYLDLLFNQL